MNLSITVDDREVRRAFAKAPAMTVRNIRSWVGKTAALTERTAKRNLTSKVSRASTGYTLNSIHILSRLDGMNAEVKPTNKYAYWVHEGRKPGKMPPFQRGSALNKWATKLGMNPFLVARSIGRKGTKGHPFMKEAYQSVKPRAERDAEKMLNDIVRSF